MFKRLLASKLFRAGLIVTAVAYLPLILIILAAKVGLLKDPNPNPIGPGLLAFTLSWVGLGLMVAGALKARFSPPPQA